MKKILLLFAVISFLSVSAQQFPDKTFYLVDSLDLNELSTGQKQNLDSLLTVFHKNENNSSTLKLVKGLKEINNPLIEKKYYHHFANHYKTLIAKTSDAKTLKTLKLTYVEIIDELGNILSYSNDIQGAIFYWEEALQTCYDEGFESSIASDFLSELALLYSYTGMHSKASNYALKALKIDEENHDQKRLPISYGTLAYTFILNEAHDLALPYAMKALSHNTKSGKKQGMISNYNILSLLYEGKNDLDSSLYYGQKALELAIEIDDQFSVASSYEAIGSVLLKDKNFTKALFNYSKGYAITDSLGLYGYKTSCLMGMGRSHAGLGNYKEANQYLTEVYKIALKSEDLQMCFYSSQELGKLNSIHKNWKEATKYYEISIPLLDSLNNSRNIEAIASKVMQHEYEKKKVIDDKEHEKALVLEKAAKDKQEIILYISLIAFLLIIIIIVISYKKINLKNKGLEKSLDKNLILTKELHHRVKNNLEVISSLLNLQSRNIDNPKALAAIREGENRVNSIALMHQKLYQTDTISVVDFKYYTRELVDHLKTVFAKPDQNITIDVIAEQIKLDIDTAVPLGLIINELVSNCFKHAFGNNTEGNISVTIAFSDSSEQQIILIVQDNGVGLPNSFNVSKLNSLGMRLVTMLTEQLDGEVEIINKNGTYVKSIVANTELRKQLD